MKRPMEGGFNFSPQTKTKRGQILFTFRKKRNSWHIFLLIDLPEPRRAEMKLQKYSEIVAAINEACSKGDGSNVALLVKRFPEWVTLNY